MRCTAVDSEIACSAACATTAASVAGSVFALTTFERSDDAAAQFDVVRMDKIGIARRRPVEIDDETLGEALAQALGADIGADMERLKT